MRPDCIHGTVKKYGLIQAVFISCYLLAENIRQKLTHFKLKM